MLPPDEQNRLDNYYPEVTRWMAATLIIWPGLAVLASVIILILVLTGNANAPFHAWVIAFVAIVGVACIPLVSFFIQRKERIKYRNAVIAVGRNAIYRTEGFFPKERDTLAYDLVLPFARKDVVSLVCGTLSPLVGPLDSPDWLSITYCATPFVDAPKLYGSVKVRGVCYKKKYIKISYSDSLRTLQSLTLHEVSHGILSMSFPHMADSEQERIIRDSKIERTDILGLA
jgi:hypothetical protein